ncbi:uncharacterized protein SCDLUD_000311 [Saccharomycodes ludwigii]|uniref:uncharacterized protein n=1 Tax=Saccharomycodes ludwigii TaxID=36035 RepID=UPI001E89F2B7|nr:hypothetical protein SCDLUD_000311 [Saccharomycodes ludwigii]KAH3902725.1 hypothetical protein SCDLUD_000311 [Saccharomycodes ludwigii]
MTSNKNSIPAIANWNSSEILVDKKSKFQGHCCNLTDQSQIPILLEQFVNSDKNIAKASHKHMYAWRTGKLSPSATDNNNVKKNIKKNKGKKANKNDNNTTHLPTTITDVEQGSSDCGESGAGQRLLTLLERSHLVNVLVIVTRWYGGTPLGSARFRHITSIAVTSLKKGKFLS